MKTDNGNNWYILDLHNYTREFLIEIILDLVTKGKNAPQKGRILDK